MFHAPSPLVSCVFTPLVSPLHGDGSCGMYAFSLVGWFICLDWGHSGWETETLANSNSRKGWIVFPPSKAPIELTFSKFPVLPFVNKSIASKFPYIPCSSFLRGRWEDSGWYSKDVEVFQRILLEEKKSWDPKAKDKFKFSISVFVTLDACLSFLF